MWSLLIPKSQKSSEKSQGKGQRRHRTWGSLNKRLSVEHAEKSWQLIQCVLFESGSWGAVSWGPGRLLYLDGVSDFQNSLPRPFTVLLIYLRPMEKWQAIRGYDWILHSKKVLIPSVIFCIKNSEIWTCLLTCDIQLSSVL